MLTLEEKLLLSRLDSYIDYCQSQGMSQTEYSTYFISFRDQRIIDTLARKNTVHKLNLPLKGNTYKCLNLRCSNLSQKNIFENEQSILDNVTSV